MLLQMSRNYVESQKRTILYFQDWGKADVTLNFYVQHLYLQN